MDSTLFYINVVWSQTTRNFLSAFSNFLGFILMSINLDIACIIVIIYCFFDWFIQCLGGICVLFLVLEICPASFRSAILHFQVFQTIFYWNLYHIRENMKDRYVCCGYCFFLLVSTFSGFDYRFCYWECIWDELDIRCWWLLFPILVKKIIYLNSSKGLWTHCFILKMNCDVNLIFVGDFLGWYMPEAAHFYN